MVSTMLTGRARNRGALPLLPPFLYKHGHAKPTRPRPVVLCILDGWGERADRADNAILHAKTPNWHALHASAARTPICRRASIFVGLPKGQMGNSEVGHMNLGAGRVVDAGPAAHRQGDRRRLARQEPGPAPSSSPR